MASYVMHHTVGKVSIEKIKQQFNIDIEEKNIYDFLLGNLIVDSLNLKLNIPTGLTSDEITLIKHDYWLKVQEYKRTTHFRSKEDIDLCVQSPNVNLFVNKYEKIVTSDFSALGYLFHLYTDKMFFEYFLKKAFEYLDKEQKNTKNISDLKFIKILKNNKLVLAKNLFDVENKESIYNDYTIMNKMILTHYNISFDLTKMKKYAINFLNPGIEEVDYQSILDVINKVNKFIEESYKVEDSNLNVFEKDEIYKFIKYTSDQFLEEYSDIITKLLYNVYNKQRCRKKTNKI